MVCRLIEGAEDAELRQIQLETYQKYAVLAVYTPLGGEPHSKLWEAPVFEELRRAVMEQQYTCCYRLLAMGYHVDQICREFWPGGRVRVVANNGEVGWELWIGTAGEEDGIDPSLYGEVRIHIAEIKNGVRVDQKGME